MTPTHRIYDTRTDETLFEGNSEEACDQWVINNKEFTDEHKGYIWFEHIESSYPEPEYDLQEIKSRYAWGIEQGLADRGLSDSEIEWLIRQVEISNNSFQ